MKRSKASKMPLRARHLRMIRPFISCSRHSSLFPPRLAWSVHGPGLQSATTYHTAGLQSPEAIDSGVYMLHVIQGLTFIHRIGILALSIIALEWYLCYWKLYMLQNLLPIDQYVDLKEKGPSQRGLTQWNVRIFPIDTPTDPKYLLFA